MLEVFNLTEPFRGAFFRLVGTAEVLSLLTLNMISVFLFDDHFISKVNVTMTTSAVKMSVHKIYGGHFYRAPAKRVLRKVRMLRPQVRR